MKRKGLEDREGGGGPLTSGKQNGEKKPNVFYSPFETALPGLPPYSVSPILLAGRENEAER